MKKSTTVIAIATFALSTSAHAALIDRGNGMIYDSDQNITWLQDANYAMTSGYDADGLLTWAAANTWANNLVYGGYGDWRLTSITDTGNDGCNLGYNGTDCGYNVNTSGSELAYMWYNILGNTPFSDTSGNSPQIGWGLTSTSADGVNFLNLQSDPYWSGTEYAPNTDLAWYLHTSSGEQSALPNDQLLYAWAVRDGDVALNRDAVPVPAPAPVLLFGAGILGMMAAKRRRS